MSRRTSSLRPLHYSWPFSHRTVNISLFKEFRQSRISVVRKGRKGAANATTRATFPGTDSCSSHGGSGAHGTAHSVRPGPRSHQCSCTRHTKPKVTLTSIPAALNKLEKCCLQTSLHCWLHQPGAKHVQGQVTTATYCCYFSLIANKKYNPNGQTEK